MKEFEAARKALGDGPAPAKRAMQRARLLRGESTESRHVTRWVLAGGAAFAVAIALFVVTRSGETVTSGEQLTAGSVTHFAHGTRLTLSLATTAHLDTVNEKQVEVVLDSGRLDAEVTKGTGRTWRYHAGPWVVRVVGTKLHVAWEPIHQTLEVGVSEGVVEVSRDGQESVLVRAGELLHRQPAAVEAQVAPVPEVPHDAPPPRPLVLPGPSRSPVPAKTQPTAVIPEAQPIVEATRAPSWRDLLTAGRRTEALERAEADHVFSQLDLLADADALLLADAARLEQRLETARQLLDHVLLRGRSDAAEAAFLLGRLDADAHAQSMARQHFGQCVALAPSGPFAEQARGRLLEVLLEQQDLDAARLVARDYLASHPTGAWATLAKKLERSR